MRFLLTAVLCTVFCFSACAQKAPFKFGSVPIEDLKMNRYEKDTAAAAVVLGDYGTSNITYSQSTGDWTVNFERIQRIKILKKDGYDLANFEIPLYRNSSDNEKLSGLKVLTHNLENGKDVETKMKSDAVFDEEYDQNVMIKKFTAPNVKEGSVIEVTYEIASDFIQYFRDWEFQSTVPIVWTEYRANIPEFFNYKQYMHGYVLLAINENKVNAKSLTITTKERSGGKVSQTTYSSDEIRFNEQAYRWVAQDVPGFKEEPFMTTAADYLSKINFELAYVKFPDEPMQPMMGTWADLNRSFLESANFGAAIKGSMFLKKTTEETIAGATTEQEKLIAIYTFVKSNMEWNGAYRKYLTSNFKKSLEEKKGSSAEINLLLVAMLQRAGIPANPVIISTRNHGFIRQEVALSSQFNYVICQAEIGGKSILLDATDRLLPINLLPERCLNGKGYIISETAPGWISLSAPKSKIYANAELTFSPTGELTGKIDITNDGYNAYAFRRAYFKTGEAEYIKDFSDGHAWEIKKSSFENVNNLSQAAKEKYEFTHIENFGDASILYINPVVHLRVDENPFRLEDRVYPVDFGKASERTLICNISIPENYLADELPKPKVVLLPNNGGKFTYNVQVVGKTINVISILSINQSLFTQLEYKGLREFYDLVVSKHAEQIVLKKKI
jgi:virulence-associated protein VapD